MLWARRPNQVTSLFYLHVKKKKKSKMLKETADSELINLKIQYIFGIFPLHRSSLLGPYPINSTGGA